MKHTKGNLFKGQGIISNKVPYNKPLHPTCREGILNTTGADESQCLKLDPWFVRKAVLALTTSQKRSCRNK